VDPITASVLLLVAWLGGAAYFKQKDMELQGRGLQLQETEAERRDGRLRARQTDTLALGGRKLDVEL
jgi:hypothetical protein